MDTPNICHQGTIKEIKNDTLFVEIERRAACASCHAKSVCTPFAQKDEVISIPVNNPDTFQVGENVQLKLKQSLGTKAVVIAYLCPFLVLALGLFVTYYFTKNELLSVGVAFVATTFYYLFIKSMDNKLKKHFTFLVNKINE
jgi:sigma-E factor negative regulatory protein RseC